MLMNNHHDHDEPDQDSHLVVNGNLFKDESKHSFAGSQQQVVLDIIMMMMTMMVVTMTMMMLR